VMSARWLESTPARPVSAAQIPIKPKLIPMAVAPPSHSMRPINETTSEAKKGIAV